MPLLSKNHVFCKGFEPLTFPHRKAEMSGCFLQGEGVGWFPPWATSSCACKQVNPKSAGRKARGREAYDSRQCLLYLTVICSFSACYYWML